MTIPTVGRIVYFTPSRTADNATDMNQLDLSQALRADVLYVHTDGTINLNIVDHSGVSYFRECVPLIQDATPIPTDGSAYAQWMPYQVAQAALAPPAV